MTIADMGRCTAEESLRHPEHGRGVCWWGRKFGSIGWGKKDLSPKSMSHWVGPYTVLERLCEVVNMVRMNSGRKVVVLHRDRLALYQLVQTKETMEEEGDTLDTELLSSVT
ncbi:hypothetical protein GOODEAATRI_027710, partial [Goodea atripinnis]